MQLRGYEIGEVIGRGGMATVYSGVQVSLQRPVAIKVLNEQMQQQAQAREAFEREALLIARLSHPNIIPVIERGVNEEGQPCFVMERVDGVDLSELIRTQGLSYPRKLDIALQVGRALAYAHRNGIVHRDIKPGNVIVDAEWHVRVLDFGIALLYSDDTAQNDETVMGTTAYMAPECFSGASHATAASDIYALGVMLYQLLTGVIPRPPLKRPSSFAPEVPPALDRLVLECIAPNLTQRPQRAEIVCERLLDQLQGAHISQQQAERAQAATPRKSFQLRDVLQESTRNSAYLFAEQQGQRLYVVKKQPMDERKLSVCQRVAQWDESSVVRVHGVSRGAKTFIMVMDYMAGGSLRDRMIRPWPLDEFIPVARQISKALSFAHAQDEFHGNLKADNVFFDASGQAKLAGFGSGNRGESLSLLRGQMLDAFACGALFYEMLIGERPRFHQRTLQKGEALKRLPAEVQRLLESLLRLPDTTTTELSVPMSQVLEQLNAMQDEQPTEVCSASPHIPLRAGREEGKKRWLLLLLLVLLFLVLMDVGILAWFRTG